MSIQHLTRKIKILTEKISVVVWNGNCTKRHNTVALERNAPPIDGLVTNPQRLAPRGSAFLSSATVYYFLQGMFSSKTCRLMLIHKFYKKNKLLLQLSF